MQIPASRVLEALIPGQSVAVRTSDFRGFDPAMSYTDAIARAIRGEVEGIMTPSGRLRYLRILPEAERQPAPESIANEFKSNSTAFAQTHLGVYRMAIREAIMKQDAYGNRTVAASGDVVGHIYQHCGVSNA